jgi:Uncharacterized protein conserved in bacteria
MYQFQHQQMDPRTERTWAIAAHLATFAGYVIPFGNVIAPLVIYLMKREESSFVADQAKESLNFQISVMLLALVGLLLSFIGIGVLLLVAVAIAEVVLAIVAAIQAGEGKRYRYPFTLRLVQ